MSLEADLVFGRFGHKLLLKASLKVIMADLVFLKPLFTPSMMHGDRGKL